MREATDRSPYAPSSSSKPAGTKSPWAHEQEHDDDTAIFDSSAQTPWEEEVAVDTGLCGMPKSTQRALVPPWVIQATARPGYEHGSDGNWDNNGAESDDSTSDVLIEPATAARTVARMCDTCGSLLSGTICQCAALAIQHPVTKMLNRARAAQHATTQESHSGAGVNPGGAFLSDGTGDSRGANRGHGEETLHV